jgi:ParB family chromosome partitioning protein
VDDISLPLLTKMSSERTLAVQAAVVQQTPKAVALLAWTLCRDLLSHHWGATSALKASLRCSHHSLLENAPSGKEGTAYLALKAEIERVTAMLPEGWDRDGSGMGPAVYASASGCILPLQSIVGDCQRDAG